MMKRSIYTLQRIAAELDEAASVVEHQLRITGQMPDPSIVQGSHIQHPAYGLLVFRMASLNATQGEAKRSFQQFDPRVIQDLYFLQNFILQTFNQPADVAVSLEMEDGNTGLVKTLILTSRQTNNVFRMQVQSSSLALRSNPICFELLDGVRCGQMGAVMP